MNGVKSEWQHSRKYNGNCIVFQTYIRKKGLSHTYLILAVFWTMHLSSVSAFPHATDRLVTKHAVSDGDHLCV